MAVWVRRVAPGRWACEPARQPRDATGVHAPRLGGGHEAAADPGVAILGELAPQHRARTAQRHPAQPRDPARAVARLAQAPVARRVHAERRARMRGHAHAVEDVEEDVLREVRLRHHAARVVAHDPRLARGNRGRPRRQPREQRLQLEPARGDEVGERAVVVVEVGLEVAARQPELGVQQRLVERRPVTRDPLALRQPVGGRVRRREAVLRQRGRRQCHQHPCRRQADQPSHSAAG